MRYIETCVVKRMMHSQESRVSSSQDTLLIREGNRSNVPAMVNDINSSVSNDVSTNNEELKVEKMAATSNQEGEKSDSLYPWLTNFGDICRAALRCKNCKKLENMMKKFLGHIQGNVKTCYTRPNRAAKLRKCINETLLFFHLYYQDVREPGKHSSYLNLMTELVSMYVDMEIKAASRRKEWVKKITCRLTSAVYLFLDKSEDHVLDAVLKAKMINKHNRDVCLPLLGKVVSQVPTPLNEMSYVRYLLIFKLFKKVAQNAEKGKQNSEEGKRINKMAILKLKPPANFVEKAKIFSNVLPKIPPKSKKNITHFFMRAKLNLRSACSAFLKGAAEFHEVLNGSSSKEVLFSKSVSVSADNAGGSNILNDMWSSLNMKSLGEGYPLRSAVSNKKDAASKKVKEKVKKKAKNMKIVKNKEKDLEKIRKKKLKKNKILGASGDSVSMLDSKLTNSKKAKGNKAKKKKKKILDTSGDSESILDSKLSKKAKGNKAKKKKEKVTGEIAVITCESTDESISLPEASPNADSVRTDHGVLNNMSSRGLSNSFVSAGLMQKKDLGKDRSDVSGMAAEISASVSCREKSSTSMSAPIPAYNPLSAVCTAIPPPPHPCYTSPPPSTHELPSTTTPRGGPIPPYVRLVPTERLLNSQLKRNSDSQATSSASGSGRPPTSQQASVCSSSMQTSRRNLPGICSGLPAGFTPSIPPPPLPTFSSRPPPIPSFLPQGSVSFLPPLPSSPAPLQPPLPRSPAPPPPPLPSTPAPNSSSFPLHSMSVPPPSLALFSTIPPPPPPPNRSHSLPPPVHLPGPPPPILPVLPHATPPAHRPPTTPPPPVRPPPTPPPPPSVSRPVMPIAPNMSHTVPVFSSPSLHSTPFSSSVSHSHLSSTYVSSSPTSSVPPNVALSTPNSYSRVTTVIPPDVSKANPPVCRTPPTQPCPLTSPPPSIPSPRTPSFNSSLPPSCTLTPLSPSRTPPSSPPSSPIRPSPSYTPILPSSSLTSNTLHPSNSPFLPAQSSSSTPPPQVITPAVLTPTSISSQSHTPHVSSPTQSCVTVFSTYTPASPSPSPSPSCSPSPSPSPSPSLSPNSPRSPSPSSIPMSRTPSRSPAQCSPPRISTPSSPVRTTPPPTPVSESSSLLPISTVSLTVSSRSSTPNVSLAVSSQQPSPNTTIVSSQVCNSSSAVLSSTPVPCASSSPSTTTSLANNGADAVVNVNLPIASLSKTSCSTPPLLSVLQLTHSSFPVSTNQTLVCTTLESSSAPCKTTVPLTVSSRSISPVQSASSHSLSSDTVCVASSAAVRTPVTSSSVPISVPRAPPTASPVSCQSKCVADTKLSVTVTVTKPLQTPSCTISITESQPPLSPSFQEKPTTTSQVVDSVASPERRPVSPCKPSASSVCSRSVTPYRFSSVSSQAASNTMDTSDFSPKLSAMPSSSLESTVFPIPSATVLPPIISTASSQTVSRTDAMTVRPPAQASSSCTPPLSELHLTHSSSHLEQPTTTTCDVDSPSKMASSPVELLTIQNTCKGPCDSSPALLEPSSPITCFSSSVVASSEERIVEVGAEVEVEVEEDAEAEVDADTLVSQVADESQESLLNGTSRELALGEKVQVRTEDEKVICDSAGENMLLAESDVYSDECEVVEPEICVKGKMFGGVQFSNIDSIIAPLGQARNTVIASSGHESLGPSSSENDPKCLITSQICKSEVQDNEAVSCNKGKVGMDTVSQRIVCDPVLVASPIQNDTESEDCSPANNEELCQIDIDSDREILESYPTSLVATTNDDLVSEMIVGDHLLFGFHNGLGIMTLDPSQAEDHNLMMYIGGVPADFSQFAREGQDNMVSIVGEDMLHHDQVGNFIMEHDGVQEGAEEITNPPDNRRHKHGGKHPPPGVTHGSYSDDEKDISDASPNGSVETESVPHSPVHLGVYSSNTRYSQNDGNDSDASPSSSVENESVLHSPIRRSAYISSTLYTHNEVESRKSRHHRPQEWSKITSMGSGRIPQVNNIRHLEQTPQSSSSESRENSSAEESPTKVSNTESLRSSLSHHLIGNRTAKIELTHIDREPAPRAFPDVVLDAQKAGEQREQEPSRADSRGMLMDTNVSRGKLGRPYVDTVYRGVPLQAPTAPTSIPYPSITNQMTSKGAPPVDNTLFKCTCSECYANHLLFVSGYSSVPPGGPPLPLSFHNPHVETDTYKLKSAEKLKSEDEELLRRIEESLAKNKLDDILDTKYKPELDSSLPLKKRLKTITAVSKIKSEPTEKWETLKEDSFPSYPTKPMISIAELDFTERLFSKHVQRPIKTVMSNNPQRYLPYAYFQQMQQSKEGNKFQNDLPQYRQRNAEVSSTVNIPAGIPRRETPVYQCCPAVGQIATDKNVKRQQPMQQLYFTTTTTTTTTTISTITTINNINTREKIVTSDGRNVSVKLEAVDNVKLELPTVNQSPTINSTVNSWEYSGRQFKTPAQLKELPAVNYYIGMPVIKWDGSRSDSSSLSNSSGCVPKLNSNEEVKYGYSQYSKSRALDLSHEETKMSKCQRNRWHKNNVPGESNSRSRNSKKSSRSQVVGQNSTASNVYFPAEKKIHRKQVSR